jgi:hypothetical protein
MRDPLQQETLRMPNWIERVIGRFKTTPAIAIDTDSSLTACSLMPYLAAARRLLDQFCPRRLEQRGPPKLMGLTGRMWVVVLLIISAYTGHCDALVLIALASEKGGVEWIL